MVVVRISAMFIIIRAKLLKSLFYRKTRRDKPEPLINRYLCAFAYREMTEDFRGPLFDPFFMNIKPLLNSFTTHRHQNSYFVTKIMFFFSLS